MQKAAKEKSSLLWFIALAMLTCAPSFASSIHVLPAENRVEIFLLGGQNGVSQQAFESANRVENYDSAWGAASESSVAPKAGAGFNPSPGVTVRKTGHYFIKEVDPNASALARWHGERSLRFQSEALAKLGDMAPPHLLKNGKLITRDAGAYTPGNFWRTYAKGSWRLGTPVNDIRPHNMGANGLIFDPALDPLVRPRGCFA